MLNQQYMIWIDLFREFTKRELSVRYKKTLFGFLWMFLNPLLQMLIIGFVFGSFIPKPEQLDNYFVFIFLGLLVWNFFSNTVLKNTTLYVNERVLLQKSKFPKEIVLLSVIASNFIHFCISLLIFLLYIVAAHILSGSYNSIVLMLMNLHYGVLFLFWLLLFISGISLLLSALNVRYRDVNFFITALMPLWFYCSPIIWELKILPAKWHLVAYLNPLVGILEFSRKFFLAIDITNSLGIALSVFASVVAMLLGIVVFRKQSNYFDDWL